MALVGGNVHSTGDRATKNSRMLSGIARHWHAPRWWLPQAVCIHEHEGAWNDNTGNGYYGGMQFTLATWRSVGGGTSSRADAANRRSAWGKLRADVATPREQLYRAWLVYVRDGHSWREWSSRIPCGLR